MPLFLTAWPPSRRSITPNGQAGTQYPQPLQMSSCTTTVPNSVRKREPVGQTSRQAAWVQCLQTSDSMSQRKSGRSDPSSTLFGCSMNATCRRVLAPSSAVLSYDEPSRLKPSSGTPFHSLQATSQALQPMQTDVSVKNPMRGRSSVQPASAATPGWGPYSSLPIRLTLVVGPGSCKVRANSAKLERTSEGGAGGRKTLAGPVLRQVRGADRLGRGAAVESPRTDERFHARTDGARVVGSICPYCAVGCAQRVFVKDDKVIQIEGDPASPISRGRLCPKGAASLQLTTGSNREYAVKYRPPHGTDWEDRELDPAMNLIADRVIRSRRDYWQQEVDGRRVNRTMGIASLGGPTLDNEENYLMKKLYTAMGAIQIENQARI